MACTCTTKYCEHYESDFDRFIKENPIEDDVLQFLKESNAIEGVFEDEQLVDAFKAWEYLMTQDSLDIPQVLETHRILMQGRDAWSESTISLIGREGIGAFREIPIWIGGRLGMRADLIPDAVEKWCKDTMNVVKTNRDFDPIKLHVEYEGIHPFADGNGRTGRLFLNWTRVKRLGLPIFVIKNSEKEEYYKLFREQNGQPVQEVSTSSEKGNGEVREG